MRPRWLPPAPSSSWRLGGVSGRAVAPHRVPGPLWLLILHSRSPESVLPSLPLPTGAHPHSLSARGATGMFNPPSVQKSNCFMEFLLDLKSRIGDAAL